MNAKKKTTPAALAKIEEQCQRYRECHDELFFLVGDLEDAIRELKRTAMKDIRAAAAATATHRVLIHSMICNAKAEFDSPLPRTRTFHGIKVGYAKQKGAIDFDAEAKVIERIRKMFPEQADVLIKTEESVLKTPLNNLPAADLRKLGVTVENDHDEIVLKPVSGDIEKTVAALLKEAA